MVCCNVWKKERRKNNKVRLIILHRCAGERHKVLCVPEKQHRGGSLLHRGPTAAVKSGTKEEGGRKEGRIKLGDESADGGIFSFEEGFPVVENFNFLFREVSDAVSIIEVIGIQRHLCEGP